MLGANPDIPEKQKIYDRVRRNLIFTSSAVLVVCFLNLKIAKIPIIDLPMDEASSVKVGVVLLLIQLYCLWKYFVSAKDVGDGDKINREVTKFKKRYLEKATNKRLRLFEHYGKCYRFEAYRPPSGEETLTLYPSEHEGKIWEEGEKVSFVYNMPLFFIRTSIYTCCRSGFWLEYKFPFYQGLLALAYLILHYFV